MELNLPARSAAIALAAGALTLTLTSCASGTETSIDKDKGTSQSTNAPTAVDSYTLADGTTVAIDPKAPTPPEVVADLQAKLAPAFAPALTEIGGDDRDAALSLAEKETGKTVIVVGRWLSSGDTPDLPNKIVWTASQPTRCTPVDTKNQALSCAESYINGRYDRYTILVMNDG